MSEQTFILLERFEGKLACISIAIHIKAEVIRPEIIIPKPSASPSTFKQI